MPRWSASGTGPRAWNSLPASRHSPAAAVVLPASRASAFAKIGYYALLLYVFVYLSRVLDLTVPFLRIPRVLSLVFLSAAVVSGGVLLFFRSRVGLLVAAFYCWAAVGLPFSVWRRGSLDSLMQFTRSVVLMVAIIALVETTRQCLAVMHTIGLAAVAGAAASRVFSAQDATERLSLSAGTFADPNFYCLVLYTSLPFLWLRARNARSPLAKAFYLLGSVGALGVGAATGSRTGMVVLSVMVAVLFFHSSMGRKLRILVTSGILVLVAMLVYSDYIVQRYVTFFTVQADTGLSEEAVRNLEGEAVASTMSRLTLLQRSLELTGQHPLLGVGMGMFAVAENEDARAQGRPRGLWYATHNSYTQVSSETGLPGFLLYAAALILGVRAVIRVRKMPGPADSPAREQLRRAAGYLQVAFLGLLAGATFLSIAYQGLIFMLLGLVVVLERSAAREFGPQTPTVTQAPASSRG